MLLSIASKCRASRVASLGGRIWQTASPSRCRLPTRQQCRQETQHRQSNEHHGYTKYKEKARQHGGRMFWFDNPYTDTRTFMTDNLAVVAYYVPPVVLLLVGLQWLSGPSAALDPDRLGKLHSENRQKIANKSTNKTWEDGLEVTKSGPHHADVIVTRSHIGLRLKFVPTGLIFGHDVLLVEGWHHEDDVVPEIPVPSVITKLNGRYIRELSKEEIKTLLKDTRPLDVAFDDSILEYEARG